MSPQSGITKSRIRDGKNHRENCPRTNSELSPCSSRLLLTASPPAYTSLKLGLNFELVRGRHRCGSAVFLAPCGGLSSPATAVGTKCARTNSRIEHGYNNQDLTGWSWLYFLRTLKLRASAYLLSKPLCHHIVDGLTKTFCLAPLTNGAGSKALIGRRHLWLKKVDRNRILFVDALPGIKYI